ncbi:minor capsid protein [[Clostridium] polysaccharolyticum]|uniref:Phage putative head morphogenesis protein, SPP1 gp7 family n=1 Tax=[Clostridium] polysaccharolyticum TaxID=29364 RepID=A0A1H9YIH2_9FIRM|nr:minor capsid protein [[Clostridium] polysaccharolyticum]SES68861.1 phage putative head morphogenesis protein, SPP1 gp7 family [[Clostridium] polysaccharolyticum]
MSKESAYWKERFVQLENDSYVNSQKYYNDLQEIFRRAKNDITMDIEKWYMRLADNNDISLYAARKLLKKNELEEFKWDVDRYIQAGEDNAVDGAWMKQLENASARHHISYLEASKIAIEQHCELLSTLYEGGVTDFLKQSYSEAYYKSVFEIQKGAGIGFEFTKIDPNKVDLLIHKPWAVDGKNFSDRIWSNKTKLINELQNQLTQNYILGREPGKAIDAISKKLDVSKKNAGRLVMTESAFFSSVAQKDCFSDLGVEQFEVVATLDSHTSDICQSMDGQHFPMSQWQVGVTAPPFHVWCRSTTVPFFDDEFDLVGTRAAKGSDGKTYEVHSNMKYKEWKEKFLKEG